MDRLLNLQTALSLGYVASMIGLAHLSSRYILPSSSTLKTRLIFLWLAFDCICHLTLEGSFLYLSVQSRTVNASASFFGYLWQEYAAADARWGTADPTLVSMEWITVLLAGPLAGYCAWLLGRGDKTYHYWVVVLSTAELYGGWMTFAPEWLTGSRGLTTSDWLLLWVYLVFMNLVWVVVPAWLMWDSYGFVATSLRQSSVVDTTVTSTVVEKETARPIRSRTTSIRGLSGSAYLLLLTAVFIYIMPRGVSASSATSSTALPSNHIQQLLTTLKDFFVPMLLPLGLVAFTFFFGALQVIEKTLRKVRKTNRSRRRKLLATLDIDEKVSPRTIIGFFHPYCNAGGGGERVLYEAIQLHLSLDSECIVAIYTGDFPTASKEQILDKASKRFGIRLDAHRIVMIGLTRRWMVEDSTWKSFTLLGQSYGSIWLGFEALSQLIPDVYLDTMGYAFTYPTVRLFTRTVPIGAYVHYPIISTDMLQRVAARQPGHTNAVAASWIKSRVKLHYYRLFARVYAWALNRADAMVANGSWTQAHLEQLTGRRVGKVYPPCDTDEMAGFGLEARSSSRTIVSLAQFRPEKEHAMQLRILAQLLGSHPHLFAAGAAKDGGVRLVMMGSCRNAHDEARIESLRTLSRALGVDAYVDFVVNADFATILHTLAHASVGISTMKDEHFGINLVEFMASGLVTVSHKSAGPWLDIAVPSATHPLATATPADSDHTQPVGYHAETVDEFASVLADIFEAQQSNPDAVSEMRRAARARAQTVFGRNAFVQDWQGKLWNKLQNKRHKQSPQKIVEQQQQQQQQQDNKKDQ